MTIPKKQRIMKYQSSKKNTEIVFMLLVSMKNTDCNHYV